MPRAGGVYTLPAGNPVVTLTVISSAWANTTMSDIATALTGSMPTDGSAPMTGALRLVDGAVGTPGLTWATETTSGWYRIGANQFGFSVAGVNALSVNANRGWTIPGIAGQNALTAGSTQIGDNVGFAAGGNVYTSGANDLSIGAKGAAILHLATNGVDRLVVNSTGNITIAAPSAGTALSVTGLNNSNALVISGGVSAGQSFGARIFAGTNAADVALEVSNKAGTVDFLNLFGDGHGTLGPSGALGLSWTAAGNISISAPTSGSSLVINQFASAFALEIIGSGGAGTAAGVRVRSGTNAADVCAAFNNSANSLSFLQINGDGGITAGSPTGGNQGTGTLNATGLFVNGVAGAPQNSQAAAYQLVLADAGKSIYHPAADAARIWTIPANGTVAFPIGTMISFDNDISAGSITISITTDTLVFVPSGTTGSRVLANGGQATARKITATRWMISGVGLT